MELRENLMCPHEVVRLDGFTMIVLLDDTPLGFRLAGVYLRDDWMGIETILCHPSLSISPVIQAACVLSQRHHIDITWIPRKIPIEVLTLNSISHRVDDLITTIQRTLYEYRASTRFRHNDYAKYLSFFYKQLKAFQEKRYIKPDEFIEPFPENEQLGHHSFRIEGVKAREEIIELIANETEEDHQPFRSFALFFKVDKKVALISHKGDPSDGPMKRVLQLAMDHHTRIIWIKEIDNPISASLRLVQPVRFIGLLLCSLSSHMMDNNDVATPTNIKWRIISREIMVEVEAHEQRTLIPLKPEVN